MDKKNDFLAAVVIPLTQALITGILFGLLVTCAWLLYVDVTTWRVFFMALIASGFFAWLGNVDRWRAWVEAALGIVQEDDREPYELQIALTYNEGKAGDFLGLPVDYIRFEQFCAGIAAGQSLGENYWTGSRGLFAKGEYHKLRAELEARGLVRLRGHHHATGYQLTGKGRALAREMARRYAARLSPTQRIYNPNAPNSRGDASERAGERRG